MAVTKEVIKAVDPWETDKTNWEYVSIPEENALGQKHDTIGLHGLNTSHLFEAGQTYFVPAQVAAYVKDRLKVYNRSVVRILQPNRDVSAERAVSIGSVSGGSAQSVDPSTF